MGREREKVMERSKPLHNFQMEDLKWANTKLLRCMKVDSNGEPDDDHHLKSSLSVERGGFIGLQRREPEFERRGSASDRNKRENCFKVWPVSSSPSPVRMEAGSSVRKLRIGDEGIEAFREKLMDDLHMKAGKIKDAILREGLVEKEEGEIPPSPLPAKSSIQPPVLETDGASRPWNLRTRRAACKAPINGGGSGGENGDGGRSSLNVDALSKKPTDNSSPSRNGSKSPKSNDGGVAAPSGEKREREKFSIQLTRSEMEADFMNIAGQRLPRRPKKRPRSVQKMLENLTPGFWLTEVNADMYKVPDPTETGKR